MICNHRKKERNETKKHTVAETTTAATTGYMISWHIGVISCMVSILKRCTLSYACAIAGGMIKNDKEIDRKSSQGVWKCVNTVALITISWKY